jgi:hypothetical protein
VKQVNTMQPSLAGRIVGRMARDIKGLFGIDSYLRNEDRSVLEQVIFTYFLNMQQYRKVLFVGCHWYTKGYNRRFEESTGYWTIDVDPSRRRYGGQKHIVDGVQNLRSHFSAGGLDLILCNGVFGWGLNAKQEVEQAFSACFDCLRIGGVLVIGWDDIEERRPFPLEQCSSLQAFVPMCFPPLGTACFRTDTMYRHTYNFYIKPG